MGKTIIVQSIKEVDLSGLKYPMIAVYQNPMDFQGYCVAKVFDGPYPTDIAVIRGYLVEIQRDIRKNTVGMRFMPRDENDPLSIIGTWI